MYWEVFYNGIFRVLFTIIPTAWKNAKMVLIFKKGDKKNLNSYRQICLLSNSYKVLTKVLTKKTREDTR